MLILISIHALLAESDGGSGVGSWPLAIFLSTLSLRRATVEEVSGDTWQRDFYPRSPCGERPSRRYPAILGSVISIHALLAESDIYNRDTELLSTDFYPRSPCGERHRNIS